MAAERSSPTQFDMQEQIDSDLDMYLTKTFADAYGADIEQTEAIDRIQREVGTTWRSVSQCYTPLQFKQLHHYSI